MLDALAVFVERDHLGDSFFLTLLAAHDELKFDTHMGASPGSSGRGRSQAIVPEWLYNPQHLSALTVRRCLRPVAQTTVNRRGRKPRGGQTSGESPRASWSWRG